MLEGQNRLIELVGRQGGTAGTMKTNEGSGQAGRQGDTRGPIETDNGGGQVRRH